MLSWSSGGALPLVLAASLLSITLNPLIFATVEPIDRWLRGHPWLLDVLERPPGELVELPAGIDEAALRGHVVLIGYGRVGGIIGEALATHGIPHVVVERERVVVERLRKRGVPAVYGDAARPAILEHVHLETARLLIVAAPDPYHARRIVEVTRKANPGIDTVVRTHSDAERLYFERLGVGRVVMGERELAFGIAHYALVRYGRSDDEADETIEAIRRGGRPQDRVATLPSRRQTTPTRG
ncbi:MAG: NAD-binding protein [Gemmatimonadaceae bacterium]